MNVIAFSRNGINTTAGIATQMKQRVTLARFRDERPTLDGPVDILIRWGWTGKLQARVTYNLAAAIARASNKPAARQAMLEAHIPIPETVETRSERFPVVVRPPRHQQGREFYLCQNQDELSACLGQGVGYYAALFYPKQREFRVHVAHGQVLLVNEKRPREGQEYKRQEPIWGHHANDFIFVVLPRSEWPLEVVRWGIAAVEALGLDFGGADVMSNPIDEKNFPPIVVCEVNTGMGLENYAMLQYARYFDWLLSSNEWLEHFDVSPKEKGSNYAWRWE